MKTKELRIGNFFHKVIRSREVHLPDTSTIFEITAIPSYGVEAVRLGEIPAQVEHHDIIEFYNLSPIPITEKWLLRFGFEEIKSDWEPDEYVLRKPDSIERLFTLKRWKESFFYIEQGNVIKYVNQLQNLYFALTGEELTIKH